MDDSESKAIDDNLSELMERADIGALTTFFHAHGAFKYNKFASFNELRFESMEARAAAFFKAIKEIENGWDLLKQGLMAANQKWLWNRLLASKEAEDERLEREQEEMSKKLQVRNISCDKMARGYNSYKYFQAKR